VAATTDGDSTNDKQTRCVEEKLYDAFMSGRGVRLTAEDVSALVGPDDAILCRLENAACIEAGIIESECAMDTGASAPKTWNALVKKLRKGNRDE